MNATTPTAPGPARRLAPALGLFFLAPIVGEFLLGNLPITLLPAIVVLGPLYGGGALLIRETARRLRLAWPGILLLCLAYGIIEEVFVTQSLFNPSYLGLRLLDAGYIPALGMGAWWTVFVLSLHAIWSTAVPIALVEALAPQPRPGPWLGAIGLVFTAAVFLVGCAGLLRMELSKGFVASPAQFAWSAAVVLVLITAAVLTGREAASPAASTRSAPSPAVVLIAGLVAGALFFAAVLSRTWLPVAVSVGGMLLVWTILGTLLVIWSRGTGWGERHRVALVAAFVLTYAWHAFVQVPSVGNVSRTVDLVGDIVWGVLAVALLLQAWRRVQNQEH